MAVSVETLYTLIMTTLLATMLALQFLARHGCACQNALYPHHDCISGHHVGLTFSCQDMTVCVKKLYTFIMTTFLATMLALHFRAKTWLNCLSKYLIPSLIMTTFLATMLALHFLPRHGCGCENGLYHHHDYISSHHVGLTFSSKTWLNCL